MLADDRKTDAPAQAGAATRALGGEERIKKFGQSFWFDTDAVILNRCKDAGTTLAKTNLDAAGRPNFADGLLGVADEIKEYLN